MLTPLILLIGIGRSLPRYVSPTCVASQRGLERAMGIEPTTLSLGS
jgi:hypothetical protein